MTKINAHTEHDKQGVWGRARPRGARLAAAAAGAALLLLPAWAAAQERPVGTQYRADDDHPRVKFDVRAGGAFAAGQLSDITDPGFTAGLGIGFQLSPRVALRADGDASFLGQVDDEEFEQGLEDFFGADFTLWHYNAGLQFNLTDPRTPGPSFQLGIGAGATTMEPGDDAPDLSSNTNFTAHGALTVGTRPSENVNIFLRGKSYAIFMQDDAFIDNGLEDAFDDIWWSFPVQLGVEIAVP